MELQRLKNILRKSSYRFSAPSLVHSVQGDNYVHYVNNYYGKSQKNSMKQIEINHKLLHPSCFQNYVANYSQTIIWVTVNVSVC